MVSVTRSDSLLLENISNDQLKDQLENKFASTYSKLVKIHENENELQYSTNYQGNNTVLSFWRESHKPFDLQIKVEFNTDSQLNRSRTAPTGFSFLSLGFKNVALIAVFLLLVIISIPLILVLSLIEPFFFVLIFSTIFAIIYYRAKPATEKGGYKKQIAQADHLLLQLRIMLSEMKQHGDGNSIRRCWNCFEPVSLQDNICGQCGKSQR